MQILRPLSEKPIDKGRGGTPSIRRLWEDACGGGGCFECNSLEVCMLACEGTAHFLPQVSCRASIFLFHVVVALLGAPATLMTRQRSLPSPAWPALPLPSIPTFNVPLPQHPLVIATLSLAECLFGLTGASGGSE